MDKENLRLISNLYDAAINPDYWTKVLDGMALSIGAKGSALLMLETLDGYNYSINKLSSLFTEPSPKLAEIYEAEYSRFEGNHFANVAQSPARKIIKDLDYIQDPTEFRRRPDVAYLEEKFGIYERFAVRLNAEEAWFDCITFQYASDRGNISRREHEILKYYLPHIAKSTEISRAFIELRRRYDAVLSVLDRFLLGVFIVLPSGEIVLKNSSAKNIIWADEGLRVDYKKHLIARKSELNEKLQLAITTACDVSLENQMGSSNTMLVPKLSSADGYIIDIAPLKDTNNELGTRIKGAMVTVIDPDYGHKLNLEGLKQLYKLSEAEASVTESLIHGRTYSEIADIRNVSPETIKTQVKSIFNKTGANSRSELFAKTIKITLPFG